MEKPFHLIGIDGGATKVSVWAVQISSNDEVDLSANSTTRNYSDDPRFIQDFVPVDITTQLSEMNKSIHLTDNERQQGHVIIETFAHAIESIAVNLSEKPLLIGVGMPGLKSTDKRGIVALANGPRMPEFAMGLEEELNRRNIELHHPISQIGSDADYCGMGEEYAGDGQFKPVQNAYYLGGGTGAADAMKLRGKLTPFDQMKPWIAKTWEMKNQLGISLERYASAGGIQWVYANHYSHMTVESMNEKGIYPSQLLDLAIQGDPAAVDTFDDVSTNLAMLLFERMTTVFSGWRDLFEFVSPDKENPEKEHAYSGILLDRIIIGQRLGDLIEQSRASHILWEQIKGNLEHLFETTRDLEKVFRDHYCPEGLLNESLFTTSRLREAPVLGAAMEAYLSQ